MSDRIWQAAPTVPLLQWLARGSLRQNLLQAVRLWVWLRLLYGPEDEQLTLPSAFSYPDWRDRFFTPSHPSQDQKPQLHDPDCPCAKTTVAWLFTSDLKLSQPQWEQQLTTTSARSELTQQIQTFRQALSDHNQLPANFETLLEARLFGFTRRTLYGDLRLLADIHWLQPKGNQFSKVTTWPDYPAQAEKLSLASYQELGFLTQPDLAAIAENLSRPLGRDRRFFVHVDYVIAHQKLDKVDDWQALLAELWQQHPVPPVRLSYQRAGETHAHPLLVYPVCIYYYRRGPYLCAYGQVPHQPSNALDWRNYRLDRIEAIEILDWNQADIPADLQQRYLRQTLPTPDDIETAMADAWGFDYYQPSQRLLLRFDSEWNRRYIQDTLRHSTFTQISYQQVAQRLQQHLSGQPQQEMLALWRDRSQHDAYYEAQYRQNDPNVRQRLRAWRPHVEVLLPWDLRQRMITEIKKEIEFYGL
ncbi:MAG: TIGR03985 family CRISPR-associated protein [Leptolyngbya sp. SIO4C5]|nr:TIGR03985 family CRISPR-associated protein [Leptolyngbya sp. SIO4C5]